MKTDPSHLNGHRCPHIIYHQNSHSEPSLQLAEQSLQMENLIFKKKTRLVKENKTILLQNSLVCETIYIYWSKEQISTLSEGAGI